MFYSQFILAKKGPLGTIWIAAHLERKLRKNQVADTDIGVSVDSILFPEMPIALRLSSHLLLGVVRIYSKKVNYLFDDCSEALLKVKQAFRSTAVDLPPEETTAPYHSITLPETFDLDDFELPDNDLQGNYVDQHISSKDQITLQDTMDGVVYSTSKFGLDERFGDDDASGLDLDEELLDEKAATPELATGASDSGDDHPASDYGDDGGLNQDLDDYDGDNEPVDYAEGPCTPGLWEEPNLSNVQDTSACDEHHEPENHAITEAAVKENLENVFSHERQTQFELHEKSTPHVAETEQMVHGFGSTPFTQPLSTETVIPVSNEPAKVEILPNKKVRDGPPPGFQTALNNHGNFGEYQGSQNPGVQSGNDRYGNFVQNQGNQPNTLHRITELESNAGKDNLVGTPVLIPHDSMPDSNFPSLRPCITTMDHETTAEGQHAVIDQNHQVRVDNVIQKEVQAERINSYTNDFSAPVTQREVQVENINSYANDFPAPEKRLPLPHWLSDVPKSFVPESTPIEKDATSGKKRSFTESSMTDQTLNLNESSGFLNTNTTPQSLNLNASSSFYNTNTTAQGLNLNQSSGFLTTNTPAQSLNLNQSSGFLTTNTPAQSLNLNQSSGVFTTDTTAQSQSLNQSSGFYTTNTTSQSKNLNQSSGFYTTNTPAHSQNLTPSSGFYTTSTPAPSQNLNQSSGFYTTSTPAPSQNLKQSSGFHITSTPAQSQNLNQSSGFFNTNTTAQSQNLNQSSGFYTTNTPAQSQNLNQSSGYYTTNTPAQSQNLNQSSSFFNTNTTAQSQNLNQSSGFYNTNTTAQSQNMNQSSGFYSTNTASQSLNLNQSSGFYNTTTTAQSLNLNQSSSAFTIDMTGQPAVNDDDLLSSILVGRKSLLKVKPGPPVVTPSAKRGRPPGSKNTAPKTSAPPKRRALMDDNMVLHGDTIRQQLTNTEDIRRLRKKAPCTSSEISMLEKQFWEDAIFSEPICTGVSVKLASLHKQLYNLSKIVVSPNDDASLGGKDPKSVSQNEKGTQPEVEPNVPKENANFVPVAQPIESPMVTDNHTRDNNTVNYDYYGSQQPQMAATEHVAEPFNSEHDLFGERTAMEIDPKSFPDADIGVPVMPTEVEPPTHADVAPSDTFEMSAPTSEVQVDASLQTDAPGVDSTERMDLRSVDVDINNVKSVESNIASETNIDVAPVKEVSEEKLDQDIEYRKNEEETVNEDTALASNVNEDAALASNVNEDVALASNVESNVQSSVYSGIFGEEYGTVAAYDTEANPVLENVPLDGKENPDHHVTFEATEMNDEDIPANNKVDDDESNHPVVENDTDFLNFDDGDDEGADAGGDYGTDVEATRVIDNSGWSSRTKAVAKYLQIMFDKEDERGRNTLAVNNMLVGKTRKEASRMFFETLVLKTKDYIHVEQPDPFGNINIFPRAKLLKSDF